MVCLLLPSAARAALLTSCKLSLFAGDVVMTLWMPCKVEELGVVCACWLMIDCASTR